MPLQQEQFAVLKSDSKWADRDYVWSHHKRGKGKVIKSHLSLVSAYIRKVSDQNLGSDKLSTIATKSRCC